MRPRFQALANELIDGFAARGEAEFVSEFAEPYSSRILCMLLGLPDDEWPQVAHWADDLGKSFGINVRADLPRIEAALEGLAGYIERVIEDRQARPQDDLVSTLIAAHEGRMRSVAESCRSRWCSSRSPAWRRPATSWASPSRPSSRIRSSGGSWPSGPSSARAPSRR